MVGPILRQTLLAKALGLPSVFSQQLIARFSPVPHSSCFSFPFACKSVAPYRKGPGGHALSQGSSRGACLSARDPPVTAQTVYSGRTLGCLGNALGKPCPCLSFLPRFFLQPRDNGSKSLKPDDLGSLRLNVVYTEDHVFSSEYYSPLRDLLLKSADVEVCVSRSYW